MQVFTITFVGRCVSERLVATLSVCTVGSLVLMDCLSLLTTIKVHSVNGFTTRYVMSVLIACETVSLSAFQYPE